MKHTDFKIRSARQFGAIHGNSPFHTAPLGVPLAALALGLLAPLLLLTIALVMQYEPTAILAISPALAAKREELDTKNAKLAAVFDEAGEEMDLKKVKKFGEEDWSQKTTSEKAELIRKANDELTEIGKEIDSLVEVEKAAGNVADYKKQMKTPGDITHAKPEEKGPGLKTLGQLVSGSKQFKDAVQHWQAGRKNGAYSFEFPDVWPSHVLAAHQAKNSGGLLGKALFETTAGWAPESTRIGRIIDEPTRPIELLDIIPTERTSQAAVVYMEETTRTHSAAETAEGTAYPESTFVLTEQSSTVRKIADSIPVTDEQLDDVAMVEGYLQNRLMFGVRQRLDGQVLSGDGVAPNLEGILNASGIQTQAKGGDPTPDAFYKAMTNVIVTGRAIPSAHVMHRNDWQAIRLLRTADGIYIWGSPSEAGPERMWGLPVVQTTQSENTGLTGDFRNFCALFERAGVVVEVGYVNTQFTEGERTLRAQARFAFVTFRPAAFCTVTGI